jgi:hypothetical protein
MAKMLDDQKCDCAREYDEKYAKKNRNETVDFKLIAGLLTFIGVVLISLLFGQGAAHGFILGIVCGVFVTLFG